MFRSADLPTVVASGHIALLDGWRIGSIGLIKGRSMEADGIGGGRLSMT
jgi:hypothetical protein